MYAQVVMWFDHEPVPIFPTQGGVNAFHACIANGHLVVAKYLAPKMEGHLFDPDDGGYSLALGSPKVSISHSGVPCQILWI